MGWLFEMAALLVADAFGEAVAKKWWVQFLASLGCLAVVGIGFCAVWLLLVLMTR
jgi:hypothetical protein